MSVLASAGMPPEAIIRSLARVGKEFRVDKEASAIIGDIELLGMDLDSALKKAAENSPSKQFGRMLDGVITTSHAGGDLGGFLREEAEKFRRERMIAMRHYIENLGMIAETYITFMVAAPLMLIVMLSVMTFIGGGVAIGNIGPDVLLTLITFVMLPAGVSIMILAVDSMSPQR
jgi:flagellar protein FlaJ